MGSLPNLHELEEAERKREKRREYELLLEQRARDTSRERERLSIFAQQRKVSAIDKSSDNIIRNSFQIIATEQNRYVLFNISISCENVFFFFLILIFYWEVMVKFCTLLEGVRFNQFYYIDLFYTYK